MMSFSIRSQTVTGTKEKRQCTQTLSGRSEEEIMDNDVNHLVDCTDDKTPSGNGVRGLLKGKWKEDTVFVFYQHHHYKTFRVRGSKLFL